MPRSKQLPLESVRILTLREIAQLWAPIAGRPESLILRELRIAVINIPRLMEGKPLLKLNEIPPDDELPSPDERVDRAWLIEFCTKQQGWDTPEFWFHHNAETRAPGRPSHKELVEATFEARCDRGETEATISAEARAICKELKEQHTVSRLPEPKTIQVHIREKWHKRQ